MATEIQLIQINIIYQGGLTQKKEKQAWKRGWKIGVGIPFVILTAQVYLSCVISQSIKEIYIYQHSMAFLLLPSARLVFYEAVGKKIKVLPLKGEELITFGQGNQERVVLSYQKTVAIHNAGQLKASNANTAFQPLSLSSFNKKLEGLTHNGKDLVFVSDKFGDIYSIDSKGQSKYLNSNLGIPTFLSYLHINGSSYIAVGDEDTRIKVYNADRMHEIKTFWFLTKRVPLQLVHNEGKIIVMLKKQQGNFNNQEGQESFVEIQELEAGKIEETEFQGRQVYLSSQVEEKEECKYQTLLARPNGKIYLIKLFSSKITLVTLHLLNDLYEFHSTSSISIAQGQWDIVSAAVHNEELILSYGKSDQSQELQANTQLYERDLLSEVGGWKASLNANEHLVVYKL